MSRLLQVQFCFFILETVISFLWILKGHTIVYPCIGIKIKKCFLYLFTKIHLILKWPCNLTLSSMLLSFVNVEVISNDITMALMQQKQTIVFTGVISIMVR